MKAALNGGLNLSILDGWWDEWYDGDNGWAIPSADGVEDTERRDDIEAAALYDLIEDEVAPRFYDLDEDELPLRWIEMVRHTLKSLGPEGAGHPDGPRLRHRALHTGRRRARAGSTRTTGRDRTRRLEARVRDGLARRADRARRVERRQDSPALGTTLTVGSTPSSES